MCHLKQQRIEKAIEVGSSTFPILQQFDNVADDTNVRTGEIEVLVDAGS